MITIDANVEIVPGNIIYNPTENVRYKVTDYALESTLKTPFLYLEPLPPFGYYRLPFHISLGSIIALGYVLENEENISA